MNNPSHKALADNLKTAARALGQMIKGEISKPEGVSGQDVEEAIIDLNMVWDRLRLSKSRRHGEAGP